MNEMTLSDGLVLTFDTNVEITLMSPESAGPDAHFVAGQYLTKECDLGCSSNWLIGTDEDLANFDSASLKPSTTVPCSDNPAAIPYGSNTRLLGLGMYTYNSFLWGSSSSEITDARQFPNLQIFPQGL